MKQNHAITLITLVITIILLIILAGIVINLTVGEEGLFNRAKQAKEEYKISELLESLELEKTDLIISKNGEAPSITEYIDHLVSKGIITTTDVEDVNENTKNITVEGYIFLVEKETDGNIKITYNKEADNIPQTETIEVTAININKDILEIQKGETETLTVTVTPSNANNKSITWSSSDETIATVDSNTGEVTAVAEGTVTITATAQDGSKVTATCSVTVTPVPTAVAGAETHEATSLTYTWAKLEEIAKVISDNYGTETGKINSDTEEVKVTIKGVTYTLGIGDYTTVKDSTEEAKKVRILGFNHDELADYNEAEDGTITYSSIYGGENRYAGISFEYVDFLIASGDDNAKMNSTDTNLGGWKESAMYATLNGSATTTGKINELENKDQIKQVTKAYCANYDSEILSYSKDYLWLLSCAEIWNNGWKSTGKGYSYGTEGSQYKYYANIDAYYGTEKDDLKKPSSVAGTSSSGTIWWLRSPLWASSGGFCSVYSTGSNEAYDSSDMHGVAPGFAI